MRGIHLLWLLALPACLVDPLPDDELAQLTLSVGLPGTAASVSISNPWDEQDLFHLQVFPKYIRASLEIEDYERDIATWPDPQRGIGSGESTAGEVELELEVEAGADLWLRVLGFVAEAGKVQVFREDQTPRVNLAAGRTTEITVDMVAHETGSVTVSVGCLAGTASAWQPVRLALVDARAQVLFPPRTLEPGASGLQVELSSLPVGRTFWTRILFTHADTGQSGQVNLLDQTILVQSAGETSQVKLDVDCTAVESTS